MLMAKLMVDKLGVSRVLRAPNEACTRLRQRQALETM